MSPEATRVEMMLQTLEQHREELLAISGVTAVAIGRKLVRGQETDRLAIMVFVERKCSVTAEELIPEEIAGLPTDVVQRVFSLQTIATNPFARFDPLISGIAIAPKAVPATPGTLGCFVQTTGKSGRYPAGVYLLTNEHVVHHAGQGGAVIQPDWTSPTPPPANYQIGNYLDGVRNATHDCAIVGLGGRTWSNVVPNKPWHPGNRRLRGLTAPAVGAAVYKYGITTRFTTAQVRHVGWTNGRVTGALYIENVNQQTWVDSGDSGSVAVTDSGDLIMGLNFQADTATAAPGGGFYAGIAYPIQSQLDVFADPGGSVTLA